tara:strand:- start:789 stop:1412 length:624 start_codon:yes stop_codon:yes gene_type:complete
VVTDDDILERQGILGVIKTVYETGGRDVALHIRGPSTYGRKIHELARKIRPMADSTGGRLFLNDRLDIAWTAGVDGVHLGQRSLPVRSVRRLVGHDLTIGASVHNEHESAIAEKEGADYAFLGTLFRTPSHHGIEPGGLSLISKMCSVIRDMPFVGIGGITPERVGGVLAAGAKGVAVIRGIWNAENPRDAVRAYLSELKLDEGEHN